MNTHGSRLLRRRFEQALGLQAPRKSARIAITAEVQFRRRGALGHRVGIFDLSAEGCRIDMVERAQLDEEVLIKLDGLEALLAKVCWIDGDMAGVEFERPLHPAVLDHVVKLKRGA